MPEGMVVATFSGPPGSGARLMAAAEEAGYVAEVDHRQHPEDADLAWVRLTEIIIERPLPEEWQQEALGRITSLAEAHGFRLRSNSTGPIGPAVRIDKLSPGQLEELSDLVAGREQPRKLIKQAMQYHCALGGEAIYAEAGTRDPLDAAHFVAQGTTPEFYEDAVAACMLGLMTGDPGDYQIPPPVAS